MTGSRFICVSTNDPISFFLVTEQCLIVYAYQIFFIHSSVVGHLCWFHVLVIVNSAAVNIGVGSQVLKETSLIIKWTEDQFSSLKYLHTFQRDKELINYKFCKVNALRRGKEEPLPLFPTKQTKSLIFHMYASSRAIGHQEIHMISRFLVMVSSSVIY